MKKKVNKKIKNTTEKRMKSKKKERKRDKNVDKRKKYIYKNLNFLNFNTINIEQV